MPTTTRPNGVKVQVIRGKRMSQWRTTLDLGNQRNLTFSASARCSGDIPQHVALAWWAMIDTPIETTDIDARMDSIHRRICKFADNLDVLWPEWNVAPDVSAFEVGTRFLLDLGGRKGTRSGPRNGVIKGLPQGRRKNYSVQFDGENYITGIPANMLHRAKVI